MFQSFLDHAFVPDSWKQANVTPVHKGKGKATSDTSSYRPVSITSILCRTFERLLNRAVLTFLEENSVLLPSQHGFRPNRSCETALTTITNYISHSIDSRTPVDLIQLDLSNAFDTLNHNLLIRKAALVGLRGSLLLWLARFVTGRTQRVLYGGSRSRSYPALSGVPQGSVLGPTLFSIYVNDMPQSSDTLLVQYADDTSIVARISSPDCSARLQDYLTRVSDWAHVNYLSVSESKSIVMRFHTTKCASLPLYTLAGSVLHNVQSASILGVRFKPALAFTLHISGAVAKARRTLGFVTRISRSLGAAAFRALYTALVLPKLEYCSSVWHPYQAQLTSKLEGVQHRATRTLFSRLGHNRNALPPYETRLQCLKWQTLEHRRTVARVGLLCRILDGSLGDANICTAVRLSKRTGQPEPLYARTVRHQHSVVPAAVRDFLSVPLKVRTPLPEDRAESRLLCREISKNL